MPDWTDSNGEGKCEVCGGDTFALFQVPASNNVPIEETWHFFLERCTSCGTPRPINWHQNYGRLGRATHLFLLPFTELPEPLQEYLRSLYPITA